MVKQENSPPAGRRLPVRRDYFHVNMAYLLRKICWIEYRKQE